MPSDEFPNIKPKYEMTQADIEGMLEVKIGPGESLQELMTYLKEPNPVIPQKVLRFIVTENFDLFLSHEIHRVLVKRLDINIADCPIPDGQVFSVFNPRKIFFRYTWSRNPNMKYIHEASENKIKKFLESKGIEIE